LVRRFVIELFLNCKSNTYNMIGSLNQLIWRKIFFNEKRKKISEVKDKNGKVFNLRVKLLDLLVDWKSVNDKKHHEIKIDK
jgi:hypothetical protein